jgi:hypothetical protein
VWSFSLPQRQARVRCTCPSLSARARKPHSKANNR